MRNNIVTVEYTGGCYIRTEALVQYDYGQILHLSGFGLPSAFQVDFGTSRVAGETVQVIGALDHVAIPDTLLQGAANIYAFIRLHTGADDGETVYVIEIPVVARPEITGEEPTPEEQDLIDQLMAALAVGVAAAEAAAAQIERMSAEASTLPAGSTATAAWDAEHGKLLLGIPKGDTGAAGTEGPEGPEGPAGSDGYSPTVTVEAITGGHRVTITDAEGDHVFDVMDGQGGGGGAVSSVNGQTGDVILDADGVGALPDDTTAADLGAYVKPAGGIPKTDLASAVQTSLGKADTALQQHQSLSAYRTAAAQDVIDAGKADKITEVTILTAGAVTQALDAGKIYHFTGALTALTVTATDPTVGKYQFDFISGSTAPTLTVPASWVMPDNFLVEPSARYSLSIQNGYCSLEKWSDSHSSFIYLDSTAGDFVMNSSGIKSDGKVYANVGSEVIAVSIDGKLKNQLADNTWLKICDISANAKALIGSTYVSSYVAVGSGKVSQCAFNTWDTSSEIRVKNNTGAALAADTQLVGTIFILRTL